jgi:hypothetical protein
VRETTQADDMEQRSAALTILEAALNDVIVGGMLCGRRWGRRLYDCKGRWHQVPQINFMIVLRVRLHRANTRPNTQQRRETKTAIHTHLLSAFI